VRARPLRLENAQYRAADGCPHGTADEVVQPLDLMIHSLYSSREIFAGRPDNLLLAIAG
jgi:hypothetical protein